jgi:hypothetical protein
MTGHDPNLGNARYKLCPTIEKGILKQLKEEIKALTVTHAGTKFLTTPTCVPLNSTSGFHRMEHLPFETFHPGIAMEFPADRLPK